MYGSVREHVNIHMHIYMRMDHRIDMCTGTHIDERMNIMCIALCIRRQRRAVKGYSKEEDHTA